MTRVRKRRTDELLDMVGLTQVAHRPIGEFSKGMTRRVGLAQALINDPEFLILDEPTSGLDPVGTRQVKDLLLELGKRGKTILLSSHLLADVEDVCHRMVVLYGGKIRAQGTAEELLADTNSTVIQTQRLRETTISRIEAGAARGGRRGHRQGAGAAAETRTVVHGHRREARAAEQVATSGAQHGGQTAAFLRADGATEGEALIEALVSEEAARAAEVRASAPARHAPVEGRSHPRQNVLEQLSGEEPAPRRRAATSRRVSCARQLPRPRPRRTSINRSSIRCWAAVGAGGGV